MGEDAPLAVPVAFDDDVKGDPVGDWPNAATARHMVRSAQRRGETTRVICAFNWEEVCAVREKKRKPLWLCDEELNRIVGNLRRSAAGSTQKNILFARSNKAGRCD